ncbi:MAG: hypothetical protein KIS87_12155 [Phycisphaeraceae bacterium]|nr:hypothetical protein [Phycisphaeraceae bacterium]
MTTPDSRAVARLNELRHAHIGGRYGDESVAIGGGRVSFCAGSPWFCRAAGLGYQGPVTGEDLDRIVGYFRSRGVEPKVEIPVFAPKELLDGLADRGFGVRQFENVYARAIAPGEDVRLALPHGWPEGLVVETMNAGDEEAVREYVLTVLHGFMPADAVTDGMIASTVRTMTRECIAGFIGRIGGRVAAVGAVEWTEIEGARLCALAGAVTVEEFRGRGVQLALISHRLNAARDLGCTIALIESFPGIATERNAARLGFTLSYARAVLTAAAAPAPTARPGASAADPGLPRR